VKIIRIVPKSVLVYIGCTLLLCFGPLFLGQYPLYVMTIMFTMIVMGQSWNLMAGYGGLLSLGNQAFIGVGGYTMTLVIMHLNWPVLAALFAGGVAALLFAVLFMFPLFRLREDYFAIGSLIMALAAQTWMINWKFAGSGQGLTLPTQGVPDQAVQYILSLILACSLTVILRIVVHSPQGLSLLALRDDQDAAETSGVNTLATKMAAVAFGAFFTGLAGGLVAMQLMQIMPASMFSVNWITDMLIMSTLGGYATLLGPVVGAVIIVALQLILQNFVNLHVIIKGILLILVVRFLPVGIVPTVGKTLLPWIARKWRNREVSGVGGNIADRAGK